MDLTIKQPHFNVFWWETNYGPWISRAYPDYNDTIDVQEEVELSFEIKSTNNRLENSDTYFMVGQRLPPANGTVKTDGTLYIKTNKFLYHTLITNNKIENKWYMGSSKNMFFISLALGEMRENKENWIKTSRHGSKLKYWTDSFFPHGPIQVNQVIKWSVTQILKNLNENYIVVTKDEPHIWNKVRSMKKINKHKEVEEMELEVEEI